MTTNNRTTTIIQGRCWLDPETYRDAGINIRSVMAGPNPEEVFIIPNVPVDPNAAAATYGASRAQR
jgi:hypothetical protein